MTVVWNGAATGPNRGMLCVDAPPIRPASAITLPDYRGALGVTRKPPLVPRDRLPAGEAEQRILCVLLKCRGATAPEVMQATQLRETQVAQTLWVLTSKGLVRTAAEKRTLKPRGRPYTVYQVVLRPKVSTRIYQGTKSE